MADQDQQQIESFLNFLIKSNIIDNSQDSETLSKYLTLYEQFSDQQHLNGDANIEGCDVTQSIHDDSQVMFETKAIFTLADFLKSLTANEYYDISQKLYNQWQQQDSKIYVDKLMKVVNIREKMMINERTVIFQKWKQFYMFSSLLEENDKLRNYMFQLSEENEVLQNEKNILELQTKKRNQISLNQIQPLRQSRSRANQQSSNNSANNYSKSQARIHNQNIPNFQNIYNLQGEGVPIYERLHKEADRKTQKQVINDVIKQQEELKNCTFQPNHQSTGPQQIGFISNQFTSPASQSARRMIPQQREDPFLFDRLSKSTKKFNPELLQMQKEAEELKDCTFKPQTNQKSKEIIGQNQVEEYQDKSQLFERLYKEAETKDKFKKSLQTIKDHAEVNSCTFQPEINTHRNVSTILSARKSSQERQHNDPFTRLHQENEQKQRSLIKIESEYEQRFKESHPFQPYRMTKDKDKQLGSRQETSQNRASRLYEEWKDRDRKIQEKRDELLKEEQKLCQLTLQSKTSRVKRQSIDQNNFDADGLNHSHQTDTSIMQSSASMLTYNTHERLYVQGKEKSRKQDELRDKVYKEQGYSFTPSTNTTSKYQVEKSLVDRNRDFIERKEMHIKEIQQQNTCDFKPQRVTAQSKLAKAYEKDENQENTNFGDKLYQQMAVIEQRKEKQRQEHQIDKNCTFKPQLARKTEKILKNRDNNSAQRTIVNGSINSKSQASFQSQLNQNMENSNRQPFQMRNINI